MFDSAPITNRMLVCFNLLPASYAHGTWYDADEAQQMRLAQLRSSAAQRTLSQWLLHRYGLDECTDFDFGPEAKGRWEKLLCLQEPQWLQRLALLMGVLRYRMALRQCIGDNTLRDLSQQIGTSAVRKALAVWPEPTFMVDPEEGIGADALVPRFLHTGANTLVPRLLNTGARWLFGLIEPLGRAVTGRVRFKFARSLAEETPIAMDDAARAAAREYLQTFIVREPSRCQ